MDRRTLTDSHASDRRGWVIAAAELHAPEAYNPFSFNDLAATWDRVRLLTALVKATRGAAERQAHEPTGIRTGVGDLHPSAQSPQAGK